MMGEQALGFFWGGLSFFLWFELFWRRRLGNLL